METKVLFGLKLKSFHRLLSSAGNWNDAIINGCSSSSKDAPAIVRWDWLIFDLERVKRHQFQRSGSNLNRLYWLCKLRWLLSNKPIRRFSMAENEEPLQPQWKQFLCFRILHHRRFLATYSSMAQRKAMAVCWSVVPPLWLLIGLAQNSCSPPDEL